MQKHNAKQNPLPLGMGSIKPRHNRSQLDRLAWGMFRDARVSKRLQLCLDASGEWTAEASAVKVTPTGQELIIAQSRADTSYGAARKAHSKLLRMLGCQEGEEEP